MLVCGTSEGQGMCVSCKLQLWLCRVVLVATLYNQSCTAAHACTPEYLAPLRSALSKLCQLT